MLCRWSISQATFKIISLSCIFSNFMTICPVETYFYLSCSGLTKTPKSEGLYLLCNFKKFFSYYLLTYLYSSIISSFKVLMEIRWNFSFSNSLIFCFCTLFYNFFSLPSSSLIPSSAMTKLLFYLPTLYFISMIIVFTSKVTLGFI